jgi:DNA-binding LacI/PurR family transcriptional regulator
LLPVVIVAAGETPGPGVRTASVDQQQIGALATRHLLELGHADVVHLSGPGDWYDAIERVRGWQDERARWGLPPAPPIQGDWTPGRGYDVARHLVVRAASGRAEDALPTAIFAANDDMAAGVIFEAQERGLRIPDDISITGFDDTLLASRIWPGLTTVRQPTRRMGEAAAQTLIDRVMGRKVEAPAPIPTTLVVRRSSGRAPERRDEAAAGAR